MATGGFRLLSVSAGSLVSDCFAVQKSMTCLSSGGKVQARVMRLLDPLSQLISLCGADNPEAHFWLGFLVAGLIVHPHG